jgi:hypothetical protein
MSFHHSVAQPEPPMPSPLNKAAGMGAARGPDSNTPQRAIMGDTLSALGSSDVVILGDEELGLPGFP